MANGEIWEGSLTMEDRKGLVAATGAGAASLLGYASASAQDDDADDGGDDVSEESVSDEFDSAFNAFETSIGDDDDADDGGDDDADDDDGDDDGDDTVVGVEDDDDSEGLAIADASGGDNNFATNFGFAS